MLLFLILAGNSAPFRFLRSYTLLLQLPILMHSCYILIYSFTYRKMCNNCTLLWAVIAYFSTNQKCGYFKSNKSHYHNSAQSALATITQNAHWFYFAAGPRSWSHTHTHTHTQYSYLYKDNVLYLQNIRSSILTASGTSLLLIWSK